MNQTLQHRLNIVAVLFLIFCFLSCRQEEQGTKASPAVYKQHLDSITNLDSMAVVLMNTDSMKARFMATKAVSLANSINSDEVLIKALNIKGLVLLIAQNDSAMFFLNLALKITDTTSFKRERGNIFYNMAQLYLEASDVKNAIILLDSSIQSGLLYGQPSAVSISLNALAALYQTTDDPQMAKTFYDSALTVATRNNLPREMGIALGNVAQFGHDTKESAGMIKKAIQLIATVKGTEVERANLLVNLGLLQENSDSAMIYYNMVIKMGENSNIPIAMIGAYNNMAYFYLEKDDVKKATQCIVDKAIPMAKKINNYDWLAALYDTYADILIKKMAFNDAVVWLRKSTEARTTYDKMIAKKQVRLLNAMLDLKNKNLIIVEKEQQIILRNARINSLKFWLAFAGFLILFLAFGYFWMRQRTRNRLQYLKLESAIKILEAEEHEKEKNGMELHDSVGMLCLKINETFEQQPSADVGIKKSIDMHIANFTDEVRNLSHRMSKKIMERHAIGPLLISLCEETAKYGKLKLQFDIGDPATEIPVQFTMHVYRIVQELLNNARKYASEANITLSVKFADKAVEIEYNDDGPGFNQDAESKKGMGLSNIFARVNLLNGTIELDTVPEHGVYWKISAPFQSPPNSL
ncbi:MAG: ATP-binding protein [Bacteroidota bacterium]